MNTLLKGSWRTSLLGFLGIVLAVVKFAIANLDGDPATVYPMSDLSAAIVTGWALVMARDNKVTSEEARGVTAPGKPSQGGLVSLLFLVCLMSVGCAKFSGQTTRQYEGTNLVSEVTRFSGYTLLDGKATLSKAKALQTTKTQSIGVDATAQESSGKTISEIGGKIIDRVVNPVP